MDTEPSKSKSPLTLVAIAIPLVLLISLMIIFNPFLKRPETIETIEKVLQISPTPTPIQTFVQPVIPVKSVYTIALLGDSMTAALGPHGGLFSEYINSAYKENGNAGIIVDNYSDPSTNIQSVQRRFNEPFDIDGKSYPPLRERKDLDLIIIESFAYNPLSHLTETESTMEHHRELKHLLDDIAKALPDTRVSLMVTIAPNSKRYALGVQDMSQDDRGKQVAERVSYLERHIELAGMYALPVINVYVESLTKDGDGDTRYINPSDNIHPSVEGIELISRTMERFIVNQRILPFSVIPQ